MYLTRTKQRVVSRQFMLAGATAFAGIAVAKFPAGEPFEFRAANSLTPDNPQNTRQLQMWAAIERESGGRVHVQVFPNSQLGSDAAMFTQLRVGVLAFYLTNPGTIAGVSPSADITNLGFAFKDELDACRVCDGPLGTFIRDEALTKGLYLLRSIWNSGMNAVGSSAHPVTTPQLAGMKLRAPTIRIFVDLLKELGASPVPISANEVYTSLQTHLIDGETASVTSIYTYRWFELNKYVSLTNLSWSGNWIVVNAGIWKTIPPDLQEIIERNNTKFAATERQETVAKNAALVDTLEKRGVTVVQSVDPSPFRARLKTYYTNWAKEFGPKQWGLLEAATGHKMG